MAQESYRMSSITRTTSSGPSTTSHHGPPQSIIPYHTLDPPPVPIIQRQTLDAGVSLGAGGNVVDLPPTYQPGWNGGH
jgi:hypothetical protein